MHGIRLTSSRGDRQVYNEITVIFDVKTRIGGEGRERFREMRCINFQPNEVFRDETSARVHVWTRVINDQEVAISLFNPTT